jgi:hypothetical protein
MAEPDRYASKRLQFPAAVVDGGLLAGPDSLSTRAPPDLLKASKIALDLVPDSSPAW